MNSKSDMQKFRDWIDSEDRYSDDVIISARKFSLELAPFFLEKMKHLLSFFTRHKTIDARARIVK